MRYMKLPFEKNYYIHVIENQERFKFIQTNIDLLNIENCEIKYVTSINPLQTIIGDFLYLSKIMPFWRNCNKGNVLNEFVNLYCLIKIAYLQNINSICIIEDDIVFDPSKIELLQDTLNNIPQNWECLRIHTVSNENITNEINNGNLSKNIPQVLHNWCLYDKYNRNINGTQCFALKRSAMIKYIHMCEKLCYPIISMNQDTKINEITDKKYYNPYYGVNPDEILNKLTNYCETYICHKLITKSIENNISTMK